MISTKPLDIKVVYDASKRRGAKTVARAILPRRAGTRAGRAVWLGLFNLAVAGAMYYGVWWQVDPYIYITLMKKTPIDLPADFASGGLFVTPDPRHSTSFGNANGPDSGNGADAAANEPSPKWVGKTAQIVIPATAYGWLALSTLAICAVGLAAGASLGFGKKASFRWIGWTLAVVTAAGIGYALYRGWSQANPSESTNGLIERLAKAQLSLKYKPIHLRTTMGAVGFLALSIGLTFSRRMFGTLRLACVMVVLASLGTVAGIWLWSQCGAIETTLPIPLLMGIAFLVHSGWGWLMWFATRRTV